MTKSPTTNYACSMEAIAVRRMKIPISVFAKTALVKLLVS